MKQALYILSLFLFSLVVSFQTKAFEGNEVYKSKSSEIKIVSISPNPAETFINVEYFLPDGETAEIIIYNFMGINLKSKNVYSQDQTVKFDLSNLHDGVYFVSLVHKSKKVDTKKLYKK